MRAVATTATATSAFRALDSDAPGQLRLKIYRRGGLIPLSDAVPVLENFGFRVLEEMPTALGGRRSATSTTSASSSRREADVDADPRARRRDRSARSPTCLRGEAENDEFNQLVLYAGLDTAGRSSGCAPGSATCARPA